MVSIICLFLLLGIVLIAAGRYMHRRGDSSWNDSTTQKTWNGNTSQWWPTYDWDEEQRRRAGAEGEQFACMLLKYALQEGDRVARNVNGVVDGQRLECDIVVVNQAGVFVIEVKNYGGYLTGNAEDYKWMEYRGDVWGSRKEVSNPIRQVNRQAGLLARYLRDNGITSIWVEGYAFLTRNNAPIDSERILQNSEQMARAIHPRKKQLTLEQVEWVYALLNGK